jgi:signal transduction histidine kinase/ActR/RegA family two-component response regulator
VVNIASTNEQKRFTDQDSTLLRLLADQVAIALENARLYEAAQRELAERRQAETSLVRRTQQLEMVRAISEEVTRELDLTTLLRLIVQRAMAFLEAPGGGLLLWEEATQTLLPHVHLGEMAALGGTRVPLGMGLVGQVGADRRGRIVNNYREWPGAMPTARERITLTALMAEPLLYRDRLVGVIGLARGGADPPFVAQDGDLLRLVAAQAAIAIENARLFQEQQRSFGELQRAQAELVRSEKLRGLGQMAAGIAHDLNNMLAAILGQVELLKLRGVPADVRDGLATLETAASDGAQVVRRLQDFARQRVASPLAPMALAPAVQEALELTRPRWQDELQQRGKTIAIHAALGDLPPILGHAPEIREVLTNLIFNAVDAMPDGGGLTLAGAATPAGVTLTLTDTGVGMPEDVRQKIFEPFFTTKGVKGTGLGLAVVYSILERHGGRVAVASAPGQGTTVTLTFQAAPAGLAAPAAAPSRRSAPRRLLLIDDEPLVRTTLGSLLRAMGHTVSEAASGADGLATLAAHPVDCVLTDLGMPEMTGWDVARAVRARHPILPIVLLTGWGEQAPGDVAEIPLVDRVLGKPVRLEDLLDTIAELTPETPRPKP